jgi:hypothetical protein
MAARRPLGRRTRATPPSPRNTLPPAKLFADKTRRGEAFIRSAAPNNFSGGILTQWPAGALIADFTIVCNSPLS